MRRFFDPNITTNDKEFTLSEVESKHIVKVLRLSLGDEIELVNGKGQCFNCTIISDHHKKCTLQVNSYDQSDKEFQIHIAISPTKQMERIEWFIEKATEIGVTEISFILCANSERNQLKLDRLIKKAVSAMKQSKRLFLPKINELESFKAFVSKQPNGAICHCYNGDKIDLKTAKLEEGSPVLIGPEGDFTHEEIELANANGYKFITLGDNRLRTETAGLYACTVQKFLEE